MLNSTKRIWLSVGLLVAAVAVLIVHASVYYPFLSDDALISLRYVDRFLQGRGLTWTDGRPVEGYSNLLWILVVAVLGRCGIDLVDAARILGVASMSTVVVVLIRAYPLRGFSAKSCLPLSSGILFFCLAAPVAVWAIGGLEQPLYAALLATSIPLTIRCLESTNPERRDLFWLSLGLGLACITRPDGPLFSVAALFSIVIGRWLARKKLFSWSNLVLLASMPVALYGGQLVFRIFYYGEWVPNTALVKIAPSFHHFLDGFAYVRHGLWSLFPFSFVALGYLIIAVFSPVRRDRALPLLVLMGAWIPYVVFIGGDIFPAHRHFVPLIVVIAFAVVECVTWLVGRVKPMTVVGLLFAATIPYLYLQDSHPENRRAISERWEWDGQVVGLLLQQSFSQQEPLVAVTAAGCLPYWSKLPALDMLGLNDDYLPRHPPADFGSGMLGHELGETAYILRREPDIITFQVGRRTSAARISRELLESAEFREHYVPIKVEGSKPYAFLATLWIRKDSKKLGIQRTPQRITVPAYFLDRNPATTAYPKRNGGLVVAVRAGAPASISIGGVPDDAWDVTVKSANANDIRSTIRHEATNLIVELTTTSETPIEIESLELDVRR